MKKFKSIAILISAFASLSTFTSCDLELLPLNEVVLENFWENKSDVQSVVNACYVSMQENSYVTQSLVWGECRSDNITQGEGVTSLTGLQQLLKGQLKPTNDLCDWSSMYVTINYCNTVLKYAPEVALEDPNFTESDLHIVQAEVKALRAMSYFTLVKTFKNVPFSFEPSIDDNQVYVVPASPGDSIIDVLIADLEAVKDYPPKYYSDEYAKNTGRITRKAMYALLADLYLWRASDKNFAKQKEYYEKSVTCCDYVIDYMIKEYESDHGEGHWKKQDFDKYVWQHFGYPLLAEEVNPGTNSGGPQAYNTIFGAGNSFESIFELVYTSGNDYVKNTEVANMYGGKNSSGGSISPYVSAADNMMPDKLTTSAKNYSQATEALPFSVITDYRSITNFQYNENGKYKILKYTMKNSEIGSGNRQGTVGASQWSPMTADPSYRDSKDNTAPFIMYRLTDVMLMRAEAEICLAGLINTDAKPKQYSEGRRKGSECFNQDSLLYDDAFNLISAVYMRSNPSAQTVPTAAPQRASMTTYNDFITLVELERRREFMFEGKRYFDLVRRARREGNTSHFATAVSAKYGEASRAVLIKMSMMDFMYMPYLKQQCKINPYLRQNEAYSEEDEYVKN